MTLVEYQQAKAAAAASARALLETAVKENRASNPTEEIEIRKHESDIKDLTSKILVFERRDAYAETQAELRQSNGRVTNPIQSGTGGLPPLEGRHNYSLLKGIRQSVEQREGTGRVDGLELEVHQELRKYSLSEPKGILISWNLATHRDQNVPIEKRNLTIATGAGGIASILGTELIDVLRNKMVMQKLGARFLADMIGGTFSLPKRSATATAYYVAEGNSPAQSNTALGQVTWTPRTLAANTIISRKFMLQTSLNAEALAREDIALVLGIEFDRAGLNGTGVGQQPTGILQNSSTDITTACGTNGGDPTFALMILLESLVAAGNADFGKLNYLSSAKGRGKLKGIQKAANYPEYLWENYANAPEPGVGIINGYPAWATNQLPANLVKGSATTQTPVIFGNFDSATYAMWGGLDILVDPYTLSTSGNIQITALQDYDFQERYTQAFAACVDMNSV